MAQAGLQIGEGVDQGNMQGRPVLAKGPWLGRSRCCQEARRHGSEKCRQGVFGAQQRWLALLGDALGELGKLGVFAANTKAITSFCSRYL